jgi:hypothetical protein
VHEAQAQLVLVLAVHSSGEDWCCMIEAKLQLGLAVHTAFGIVPQYMMEAEVKRLCNT